MLVSPKVEAKSMRLLRGFEAGGHRAGIQLERFKKSSNSTNSSMSSRQVRQHYLLSAEGNGYLGHAMEKMNFSARAHDRTLKVARTPADFAVSMEIRPNDVLEAIQDRSLDRKLFS
jgi:magnesium chelatase family protein